jgi:DNA-directed RNA polymerase subunit M/transcription elongation factor TFIIS
MTLLNYLRNDLSMVNGEILDFVRYGELNGDFDADDVKSVQDAMVSFNFIRHPDFINMILTHNDISDCDDCGHTMFNDDSISIEHGDRHVCRSCGDDDYYYSENHDTYRHNDDYDEHEEEGYDDYSGTYSYDTDVLEYCNFNKLDKENATDYYGIELEVERRKDCPSDIAETINQMYQGFAICKSDGSLDNGFEVVTGPSTYKYHKMKWEEFFNSKLCQENLKGWNTDTAGLHIHIGRKSLTPLNIGKILVFINDNNNEDFINHIAGRSSQQWARKSPKKVSDVLRPTGEKYDAVNTNHHATIELRIFRSNISRHGFYRVLEFTDAMVNFVKLTNCTTTSLHYTAFIRFVSQAQQRSQYPNLLAWLIRKSYVKDMQPSRSVVTTDDEIITNQRG